MRKTLMRNAKAFRNHIQKARSQLSLDGFNEECLFISILFTFSMAGDAPKPDWLTTDWILSLLGKQRRIATEKYRQFILEGVQINLKFGQV